MKMQSFDLGTNSLGQNTRRKRRNMATVTDPTEERENREGKGRTEYYHMKSYGSLSILQVGPAWDQC